MNSGKGPVEQKRSVSVSYVKGIQKRHSFVLCILVICLTTVAVVHFYNCLWNYSVITTVRLHVMRRKQLESELLPDIHRNVGVLRRYRDDRLSHLQSPSTLRVAASLLHSHIFADFILSDCVYEFHSSENI